jgi:hypothetical protein
MSVLESPLDISDWRLFQVALDVVGSMLRNISNTEGRVFVHRPLLWFHLSGHNLDERRLPGTIGSNNSDTTRKSQGTRRIV